jgi:hypothetical protein
MVVADKHRKPGKIRKSTATAMKDYMTTACKFTNIT